MKKIAKKVTIMMAAILVLFAIAGCGGSGSKSGATSSIAAQPPVLATKESAPTRFTANWGPGKVAVLQWDCKTGATDYELYIAQNRVGSYYVVNAETMVYGDQICQMLIRQIDVPYSVSDQYVNSGVGYFRLRAKMEDGTFTNYTDPYQCNSTVIPPTPAGLLAVVKYGKKGFSWNYVPEAAIYTIFKSETVDGSYTQVLSRGGNLSLDYLDDVRNDSESFCYKVQANSYAGDSAMSPPICF